MSVEELMELDDVSVLTGVKYNETEDQLTIETKHGSIVLGLFDVQTMLAELFYVIPAEELTFMSRDEAERALSGWKLDYKTSQARLGRAYDENHRIVMEREKARAIAQELQAEIDLLKHTYMTEEVQPSVIVGEDVW